MAGWSTLLRVWSISVCWFTTSESCFFQEQLGTHQVPYGLGRGMGTWQELLSNLAYLWDGHVMWNTWMSQNDPSSIQCEKNMQQNTAGGGLDAFYLHSYLEK